MNSNTEDLKQIAREEKRRLMWIAILSTLLSLAYSATIVAIGLFVLPPFIGWVPFVYGFVNFGIALRTNWGTYHRMRRTIDSMISLVIKLSEQGTPVIDAIQIAEGEVKKQPADRM